MKTGEMYVDIKKRKSPDFSKYKETWRWAQSLLRYECSRFRQGTDVFSWLDLAKRLMYYTEYEGDVSDTL